MNFKEWLMHFKTVKLPIGDLAKDVAADNDFPDSSDKEVILEYLESKSAALAAIEAFENAYSFYEKDTKR